MFSCVCRCYYFCIDFPRQFLFGCVQLCMSLQSFCIDFPRLSTTVSFESCLVVYVVAIISASAFHDFPRQLLLSRVQLCMLLQSFCIGFPRLSTTIAFESCLVVYVVAIIPASTFHDFSRQLLLSRVQLCMLLQSFCIGFPRLSTTVSFESCLVVYVVAIIFASTFHDFPRQLL